MNAHQALDVPTRTLVEEILADLHKQAEIASDLWGVPSRISLAQTYWEMVLDGSMIVSLAEIQKRHAQLRAA